MKKNLLPMTETLGDMDFAISTFKAASEVRVFMQTDRHPEGGWVVRAVIEGTDKIVQKNAATCEEASTGALRMLDCVVSAETIGRVGKAGRSYEARVKSGAAQ